MFERFNHCLNILIYTLKCTGKPLLICMTAWDDNNERLVKINIHSTFDKVSKRMSLCECVYVGAVHKSYSRILHSPSWDIHPG